MKAIINTKSNYNNCNHKLLEVINVGNKYITLLIPKNGFNINGNPLSSELIQADFSISEELVYITE